MSPILASTRDQLRQQTDFNGPQAFQGVDRTAFIDNAVHGEGARASSLFTLERAGHTGQNAAQMALLRATTPQTPSPTIRVEVVGEKTSRVQGATYSVSSQAAYDQGMAIVQQEMDDATYGAPINPDVLTAMRRRAEMAVFLGTQGTAATPGTESTVSATTQPEAEKNNPQGLKLGKFLNLPQAQAEPLKQAVALETPAQVVDSQALDAKGLAQLILERQTRAPLKPEQRMLSHGLENSLTTEGPNATRIAVTQRKPDQPATIEPEIGTDLATAETPHRRTAGERYAARMKQRTEAANPSRPFRLDEEQS